MFRKQLRAILAGFRPTRPLIIRICLMIGLIPTLAGAVYAVYIVCAVIWNMATVPSDPAGINAIEHTAELVTAGFIFGLTLLGWWQLTRLARGYAGAAIWWIFLSVFVYLVTLTLKPHLFRTIIAAIIAATVVAVYGAAFVLIRRLRAAKAAQAPAAN